MKAETIRTTNGVDLNALQDTIAAVTKTPDLGKFNFRLTNRWIDGGSNQSEVGSFFGAGQSHEHKQQFLLAADEPAVLLGQDNGANPVEHLLHALASCVTTSMVYHAAARGIAIEGVETTLEGDLDLNGFLSLDPSVRNGYQNIRMHMRIKADVNDEQLEELSKLGPTFSPVFDSLSKGVPLAVSAERMR